MRLFSEYIVILVVTILMTVILKKIEMNDGLRLFIVMITGLLAGRLFDFIFNKKKKA